MNYQIDHIDPRWKEGRDYQLVCGLDVPLNLEEREESVNNSKSNRFLPWRVAEDELGSVPVNIGDLCQFLDRETGEWVLEEFMGAWYKKQTRDLCGSSRGGKIQSERGSGIFSPELSELKIESSRKSGAANRDNKIGIFDPANRQKVLAGAAKGNAQRMKPIVVIDLEGKKYRHDSVSEAARFHKLTGGPLRGVLKGTRSHTKHFTAYYV
jgi:hypothetical protein